MLERHENRAKFLFHTFFIVITSIRLGYSQDFKPYRQPLQPFVIDNVADYLKSIAGEDSKRLVNLKHLVPQLVIELKYSTKENFVRQVLYNKKAEAYARG